MGPIAPTLMLADFNKILHLWVRRARWALLLFRDYSLIMSNSVRLMPVEVSIIFNAI